MKKLLFIFLFSAINLFSQKDSADSLKKIIESAAHDTVKASAMLAIVQLNADDEAASSSWNEKAESLSRKLYIGDNSAIRQKGKKCLAEAMSNRAYWLLNRGENKKSLELYNIALKMQEETNDLKNLATSLNSIGLIHYNLGEVQLALDYYNKALKIFEAIRNDEGMAGGLYNIAVIYQQQGNVPQALENYRRALKALEKLNHSIGVARCLLTMGEIYGEQGDENKAIEYYNKALAIAQKVSDGIGITTAQNNLGFVYNNLGDRKKALEYHRKSMEGREKIGDQRGIAMSMINIGNIYMAQGNVDTALNYYQRSLVIRRQTASKWGLSNSMNNIAGIYYRMKKYKVAKLYCDTALTLSRELGYPAEISSAEGLMSKIDSVSGNIQGALTHYRFYVFYRDSNNNEKNRRASIKNQLNYEFEKKEMLLNERNEKDKAVAKEKSFVQKVIIICATGGLIIVIVFSAFIFKALRTTRYQKHIIEEKQNEIIDSIKYAKRIQESLLPHEKYLTGSLDRLRKK